MNTKFFATALIAAVGFAAAPSFANDLYGGEVGQVNQVPSANSGLTRAQVQNDYLQAKRNHELVATGEGAEVANAVTAQTSELTRAQVRADTRYALRHGLTIGGEV